MGRTIAASALTSQPSTDAFARHFADELVTGRTSASAALHTVAGCDAPWADSVLLALFDLLAARCCCCTPTDPAAADPTAGSGAEAPVRAAAAAWQALPWPAPRRAALRASPALPRLVAAAHDEAAAAARRAAAATLAGPALQLGTLAGSVGGGQLRRQTPARCTGELLLLRACYEAGGGGVEDAAAEAQVVDGVLGLLRHAVAGGGGVSGGEGRPGTPQVSGGGAAGRPGGACSSLTELCPGVDGAKASVAVSALLRHAAAVLALAFERRSGCVAPHLLPRSTAALLQALELLGWGGLAPPAPLPPLPTQPAGAPLFADPLSASACLGSAAAANAAEAASPLAGLGCGVYFVRGSGDDASSAAAAASDSEGWGGASASDDEGSVGGDSPVAAAAAATPQTPYDASVRREQAEAGHARAALARLLAAASAYFAGCVEGGSVAAACGAAGDASFDLVRRTWHGGAAAAASLAALLGDGDEAVAVRAAAAAADLLRATRVAAAGDGVRRRMALPTSGGGEAAPPLADSAPPVAPLVAALAALLLRGATAARAAAAGLEAAAALRAAVGGEGRKQEESAVVRVRGVWTVASAAGLEGALDLGVCCAAQCLERACGGDGDGAEVASALAALRALCAVRGVCTGLDAAVVLPGGRVRTLPSALASLCGGLAALAEEAAAAAGVRRDAVGLLAEVAAAYRLPLSQRDGATPGDLLDALHAAFFEEGAAAAAAEEASVRRAALAAMVRIAAGRRALVAHDAMHRFLRRLAALAARGAQHRCGSGGGGGAVGLAEALRRHEGCGGGGLVDVSPQQAGVLFAALVDELLQGCGGGAASGQQSHLEALREGRSNAVAALAWLVGRKAFAPELETAQVKRCVKALLPLMHVSADGAVAGEQRLCGASVRLCGALLGCAVRSGRPRLALYAAVVAVPAVSEALTCCAGGGGGGGGSRSGLLGFFRQLGELAASGDVFDVFFGINLCLLSLGCYLTPPPLGARLAAAAGGSGGGAGDDASFTCSVELNAASTLVTDQPLWDDFVRDTAQRRSAERVLFLEANSVLGGPGGATAEGGSCGDGLRFLAACAAEVLMGCGGGDAAGYAVDWFARAAEAAAGGGGVDACDDDDCAPGSAQETVVSALFGLHVCAALAEAEAGAERAVLTPEARVALARRTEALLAQPAGGGGRLRRERWCLGAAAVRCGRALGVAAADAAAADAVAAGVRRGCDGGDGCFGHLVCAEELLRLSVPRARAVPSALFELAAGVGGGSGAAGRCRDACVSLLARSAAADPAALFETLLRTACGGASPPEEKMLAAAVLRETLVVCDGGGGGGGAATRGLVAHHAARCTLSLLRAAEAGVRSAALQMLADVVSRRPTVGCVAATVLCAVRGELGAVAEAAAAAVAAAEVSSSAGGGGGSDDDDDDIMAAVEREMALLAAAAEQAAWGRPRTPAAAAAAGEEQVAAVAERTKEAACVAERVAGLEAAVAGSQVAVSMGDGVRTARLALLCPVPFVARHS